MTSTPLSLPVPHPATEGHFPGAPILPGVVLLDEAVRVIERAVGAQASGWRISSVKFLSPAGPGQALQLEYERMDGGGIRFTITTAGRTVATGQLAPHMTGASRPAAASEWRGHRERGSVRLLRIMTFISLRLGRPAGRVVLYGIAAYFFLFAPRARRASLDYLPRVLGRRARARERFRQVMSFATTIHDRLYLLNERFDLFDIEIVGEPLMAQRLRSGGGGFLIGAHLGSFEVTRSIGRRQAGLRVAMVAYEDNARKLNAMLAAINPAARVDTVALGSVEAMLRVREMLAEGVFVGMLGDRTPGTGGVMDVEFLGGVAKFPVGPMRVAALLGRPVILMLGLYLGGNRYRVVFEEIADFSGVGGGEREAAVREGVVRYAGRLEEYCRRYPFNWFNFYRFWT